jgi:hypothetical protein
MLGPITKIILPVQIFNYPIDQIKKNEMGDKVGAYRFFVGKPEGKR